MDLRTEPALIPDPRINRCKKHNLVDILLLCITAMVRGVESVGNIVFFGETRRAWLKRYPALPNGIPSADSVPRVLGRIDQRKFEACFLSWTHGCFKERISPGSVTAIDGKTVRGSACGGRKAVHIVSARAGEPGPALGQVQTEEKSNEITAVPALLEALDISGCIAAVDAMGCQKAAAQDITAEHGLYPGAERKSSEVYAEARELFEGIDEPSCSFPQYTEATRDRGRIEKREARRCTSWFAGPAAWAGLAAMGCIRSRRTVKGKVTAELR